MQNFRPLLVCPFRLCGLCIEIAALRGAAFAGLLEALPVELPFRVRAIVSSKVSGMI